MKLKELLSQNIPTKHKADTAQQVANDVRKEITDFSKMKDLAKTLNKIIQDFGGDSEDGQGNN